MKHRVFKILNFSYVKKKLRRPAALKVTLMLIAFGITLFTRLLMVLLFLPFSAWDKVSNFNSAVAQASEIARSRGSAVSLICGGLVIEVVASMAIVTGVADRLAALILALYCVLTALLWKRFWRASSPDASHALFFDFWKNLALAGGFLLITFGTNVTSVGDFLQNPLSSTRPYQF
jgi:putative oxidoreductase